jgi:hypothetical protein
MLASNRRFGRSRVLLVGSSVARLVGAVLWCVIGAVAQDTYCAFEVTVSSRSALPLRDVPVGLLDHGNQTVTSWTNAQGIAKLCDAPLHAVDIVIGANPCASGVVLVKNIRATWPTTRKVFAIYETNPCSLFVFPDQCQLLTHVQDQEGQPVAAAQFEGKPSLLPADSSSDAFGRLFGSIKRGEKVEGLITRSGYEVARVSAECVAFGDSGLEQKVVLRKK